MPIRFNCSQCGNELMAALQTAAIETRCRKCGTVVPIPRTVSDATIAELPNEEPTVSNDAVAPPIADNHNPFRSPAIGGNAASRGKTSSSRDGVVLVGIVPTPVEIGGVYSVTWQIVWAQFDSFLAASVPCLVAWAIWFAAGIAVDFGLGLSLPTSPLLSDVFPFDAGVVRRIVTLALGLVGMLVYLWIALGLVRYFQQFARGRSMPWRSIHWGPRPMLRALVLSVVLSVIGRITYIPLLFAEDPSLVALSTIPFGILYVIVALALSQSLQLLVDRDLSAIDAMRVSVKVMKGNKAALFATLVIFSLLSAIVFSVALIPALMMVGGIGVGGILSVSIALYVVWGAAALPYLASLLAVFYLQATGQPV